MNNRRLFLIIILAATAILHMAGPVASRAAVDPTDQAALEALYNSTGGAGWTTSTNWLSGDPCTNSWFGVTCNAGNTNVVQINLAGNNLSGTIPTELGNLSQLTAISLSDNSLSGSIPGELGNLTGLEYLYLQNNSLTGSIPSGLGNLANLIQLNLDDNSLTGAIPPSLGNLDNLTFLTLSNNTLSGSIPPQLGNMGSLQYLYLDYNNLSGSIPAELANLAGNTLPFLQLWLNNNKLCGTVPEVLKNLVDLDPVQGIDLNDNNLLTNVSSELSTFIENHSTSGAIPDWKTTQNSKTCFAWEMFLPAFTGGKK
ncbi:MAG: hypothetical protein Kow0089_19280 [Desulfobulbaceae bacterium]